MLCPASHHRPRLGVCLPACLARPLVSQPTSPLNPPTPQGTDYTTVCLDAERGSRLLLGAGQDRSGGEWVSCVSLEVDSLLVGTVRVVVVLQALVAGRLDIRQLLTAVQADGTRSAAAAAL